MVFWKAHEIPVGQCASFRIDHLSLWIWHQAGEWRLAHHLEAAPQALEYRPDVPVPENVEWIRYVDSEGRPEIRLLPVMPGLPLVVRPESPLHLLPLSQSSLYVGIPVTVRVELPLHNDTLLLAAFPVQALSKTWFGTPDDPRGLLCLALHSRARLTIDGLGPVDPARAICTMQLKNASHGILEYRTLALLTDHLGISQGANGRLWATTVEVTFKGIDADTGIRYLGSQAGGDRRLTPLTEPRNPATESLSSRLLGGWTR